MIRHDSAPDGGLTISIVTAEGRLVAAHMPEENTHLRQSEERDRLRDAQQPDQPLLVKAMTTAE